MTARRLLLRGLLAGLVLYLAVNLGGAIGLASLIGWEPWLWD